VYGQSEDTGPTSFNRTDKFRFGSVGPAFPGVEVKIADDEEILIRGPNVFAGYYKDQEATDATLIDGWLHSGDLGAFDAQGFLHITGRKKDIIITSGGKNITPKNIEGALKNHQLVSEAVVIGDRRKFLSVLITLDEDAAKRFEQAEIRREIERAIEQVNRDLARVETIKKFTILPAPFSIDGGELTPTLKVKRKVVAEKYAKEIDAMYAE
jgi:long-chain acyl-CoA synthetase